MPRRRGCIGPEPLAVMDIAGGGAPLGVAKVALVRQGFFQPRWMGYSGLPGHALFGEGCAFLYV